MSSVSDGNIIINNDIEIKTENTVVNTANVKLKTILILFKENYSDQFLKEFESIKNKKKELISQGQKFIGYIGIADRCSELFQKCLTYEEMKKYSLNNDNDFGISVRSSVFVGNGGYVSGNVVSNTRVVVEPGGYVAGCIINSSIDYVNPISDKELTLYKIKNHLDEIYIDYSNLYLEKGELKEAIEFLVKVSPERMKDSNRMIINRIIADWNNEEYRNAYLDILKQNSKALPILQMICQHHVNDNNFENFKITAKMMRGTDEGNAAILSFHDVWKTDHFKEFLGLIR